MEKWLSQERSWQTVRPKHFEYKGTVHNQSKGRGGEGEAGEETGEGRKTTDLPAVSEKPKDSASSREI